jgi:hypothetical protein
MSDFNVTGALRSSAVESREHDLDLSARRIVEIPSNMQMRAVYDGNNNPTYVGYAPRGMAESYVRVLADGSKEGWLLYKLDYTGTNCTSRTIGYDSWDNYLSAEYL